VVAINQHGGLAPAFSSRGDTPASVALALLQLVAFWLAGWRFRPRP
jgi:hypothetical protein